MPHEESTPELLDCLVVVEIPTYLFRLVLPGWHPLIYPERFLNYFIYLVLLISSGQKISYLWNIYVWSSIVLLISWASWSIVRFTKFPSLVVMRIGLFFSMDVFSSSFSSSHVDVSSSFSTDDVNWCCWNLWYLLKGQILSAGWPCKRSDLVLWARVESLKSLHTQTKTL